MALSEHNHSGHLHLIQNLKVQKRWTTTIQHRKERPIPIAARVKGSIRANPAAAMSVPPTTHLRRALLRVQSDLSLLAPSARLLRAANVLTLPRSPLPARDSVRTATVLFRVRASTTPKSRSLLSAHVAPSIPRMRARIIIMSANPGPAANPNRQKAASTVVLLSTNSVSAAPLPMPSIRRRNAWSMKRSTKIRRSLFV